ncbi:Armadillo-type fold [Nitzschia inconspicua]|uniref:Importin subunit alpha n=1 Tax=Nitzschia inconspicua TaxID=303405 RepID=A0A9K3LLL7_9STRA|nr:Armadillo-type fold [Nitzschia inconspicua]
MLSENSRITNRSGNFKRTVGTTDGRRSRQQTTLHIRKQRKDEQLRNKRSQVHIMDENNNIMSMSNVLRGRKATVADIPQLATVITGSQSTVLDKLEATKCLRRLLCKERNPPVNDILNCGVLPHLVYNLTADPEDYSLIFETAWVLTNVATTNTKEILAEGAAGPLVNLIVHDSPDVREQSMWCLGNIAGDGVEARDEILRHSPFPHLKRNLEKPSTLSLLQNCLWCISNLCRGDPSPDRSMTDPIVYELAITMDKLLGVSDNDEALNDLLWAFSYLSRGDEATINHVMGTGIHFKLITLIKKKRPKVLMAPIVRILGNFVGGNDNQTDCVISAGLFDCIPILLASTSANVRKETCWMLSNIARGSPEQASQLLKQRQIMESLVDRASHDWWVVRTEAIYVITSLLQSNIRTSVVVPLVAVGGLGSLVRFLEGPCADVGLVKDVLEAIETILDFGMKNTEVGFTHMLDEYGGIALIDGLQEHENEEIYGMAVRILENYCGAEDVDENLAPTADSDTGAFAFGVKKQLFDSDGVPPSFEF